MAKQPNDAPSKTLRITLSRQSVECLEQLAGRGVYGRNAAEVAGRFVDRALQEFLDLPKLKISGDPK